MKAITHLLTTTQAGEELGVTQRRVLAMIRAGRLPAQKIGFQFLIDRKDLKAVKDRKPGRPVGWRKTKDAAK